MERFSETLDAWGVPIPIPSDASRSLVESESLKPLSDLSRLKPALARAAQAVYDDWGPDEFGNIWCRSQEGPGGICHLIADDMISVISEHGFECTTISHDSRVHVSVLVKTAEGVAEVDIDPYRYETGGGYNWEKIPDVSFEPEDVSIHIINKDPEVFSQHLDEEVLSEAECRGDCQPDGQLSEISAAGSSQAEVRACSERGIPGGQGGTGSAILESWTSADFLRMLSAISMRLRPHFLPMGLQESRFLKTELKSKRLLLPYLDPSQLQLIPIERQTNLEVEPVSDIQVVNKDRDRYSDSLVEEVLSEGEYQGRKVKLNKPFRTPDGPKKFSVYTKNDKGRVVKVNFGDPNMEIKRDDPDRRKSFRARHNCDHPGPKWKARYWSCQATWHPSKKVSDVVD